MVKMLRSIIFLSVLLMLTLPVRANDGSWEYQVIILQGVMAGSTLEKQAKGFSLDTRRTKILNELAADGWEVISVIGAPLTDHAVYLRRKLNK
jgi:competence protein ComGC